MNYAGNSVDLGQLSSAVQNFNILNNGYQGNSWTYNAYVNTSNNAARNASLNTVQTALTVAGLVPGLGSPADIANAGISALRGDYTAASISMTAAVIGGVANVGSVVNKVDNGVEVANSTTLYRAVSTNELVDIGNFGFRTTPGGYETGKLFATTAADATIFGKNNYKLDGIPNHIIQASVPNSVMETATSFTADSMRAISIPAEQLNKLKSTPLNYSPLIGLK